MPARDFMPSVGQQIREQRLRLGLTLQEIAARSRIPLKTLQAIESDDLSNISSPFLYKSFVRQFTEHLKLDYGALAPAVEAVVLSMPQPRMPGEADAARAKIAPLPLKGRDKNFRWLYSVASLAFVLVGCSSLYGVWQNSKATWLAELTGLVHSAKSTGTAAAGSVFSASAPPSRLTVGVPVPTRAQKRLPKATGPATSDDGLAAADSHPRVSPDQKQPEFRVELSAIERTWLSIIEDGKETFSGVLDPAQTKVLEGHDTASIRTGNAGGISCIFNGRSIGPLGERGQVRTVVFTKTNYEVLQAPVALMHLPSLAE